MESEGVNQAAMGGLGGGAKVKNPNDLDFTQVSAAVMTVNCSIPKPSIAG